MCEGYLSVKRGAGAELGFPRRATPAARLTAASEVSRRPSFTRQPCTRANVRKALALLVAGQELIGIFSARGPSKRADEKSPADQVAQPACCTSGEFETGCLVRLTGGSRFYWWHLIDPQTWSRFANQIDAAL